MPNIWVNPNASPNIVLINYWTDITTCRALNQHLIQLIAYHIIKNKFVFSAFHSQLSIENLLPFYQHQGLKRRKYSKYSLKKSISYFFPTEDDDESTPKDWKSITFSDTVTYAKVGCHLIPCRVNKLQDSKFWEKWKMSIFSLELELLIHFWIKSKIE